jgi:hypothetical protein
MLTNEQRAHDLTMFALNNALRPEAVAALAKDTGETSITVNVEETYMNTYKSALEMFNRNFPAGK